MDEMGVSLHRDPVGGPGEGGPFTRNFENSLKEGSGYEVSLSLYGSSVRGTWSGGAPLLEALKVMKERHWGWASVFLGAQLGNLEWALPGTLRYG